MGRQIQFHALPDDMGMFLSFVQQRNEAVVALRDANAPDIEPITSPISETRTMVLWKVGLLPTLRRRRIQQTSSKTYFRVPGSLPILELTPCRSATWDGKSALLQGRVYGFDFAANSTSYGQWYSSIQRWIRAKFSRGPHGIGGYVGPVALDWFHSGGVLLPMFEPAMTPEWKALIASQH
jgi:hypothetical protein